MAHASQVHLAVDLGASSGRVVAGLFDGERLTLEDVHRFENGGIHMNDRMQWDILALWSRIVDGLRAATAKYGERIVSVGVDTWGVDFGLLGAGMSWSAIPITTAIRGQRDGWSDRFRQSAGKRFLRRPACSSWKSIRSFK